MKTLSGITRICIAVVCLSVASQAFAQGEAPTEHHAILKKDVGTWNAVLTVMMPGQDPVKMEGVEVNKMLGELWVTSEFKGEIFGTPFLGRGQFGYDAQKKKYVGTWIDSMTSSMSTMTGQFDKKTNALSFDTTQLDPATGKRVKAKNVTTYVSKDVREMKMMTEGEDGKWVTTMTIKYTRKK